MNLNEFARILSKCLCFRIEVRLFFRTFGRGLFYSKANKKFIFKKKLYKNNYRIEFHELDVT